MGNILPCVKSSQTPSAQAQRYTNVQINDSNIHSNHDNPRLKAKNLRVRALYNFQAVTKEDLPFKRNDILEIDGGTLPDNADWLEATHVMTKKKGFIPSNYVVIADSSPKAQEWWFPYDKREANKALLQMGNMPGTFLVREASDESSYALSIRHTDDKTGDPCVKHYRIRVMDGDKGYYISSKRTFASASEVIEFYMENSEGLCCKLTSPCSIIPPIVPFRKLEIEREKVRLIKKLGSGCFADVWKGIYLQVIDVAVKTLRFGTMTSEAFINEAKIMHQLRHRKLVQILGVVSSEEPFYIISELMSNGALLDFLHSDRGKELKFGNLIDMNSQISDGMAYLESVNFIHRDLRASNILVGHNNEVKVADFGLARILGDSEIYVSNPDVKYPVKWTAPEAASEKIFSVKSDVWSFGILMYEIITYGRTPYPGMSNSEALEETSRGYRMGKPTNEYFITPDTYYKMMLECWHKLPKERPTFAKLHEFFRDYFTDIEPDYSETEIL